MKIGETPTQQHMQKLAHLRIFQEAVKKDAWRRGSNGLKGNLRKASAALTSAGHHPLLQRPSSWDLEKLPIVHL